MKPSWVRTKAKPRRPGQHPPACSRAGPRPRPRHRARRPRWRSWPSSSRGVGPGARRHGPGGTVRRSPRASGRHGEVTSNVVSITDLSVGARRQSGGRSGLRRPLHWSGRRRDPSIDEGGKAAGAPPIRTEGDPTTVRLPEDRLSGSPGAPRNPSGPDVGIRSVDRRGLGGGEGGWWCRGAVPRTSTGRCAPAVRCRPRGTDRSHGPRSAARPGRCPTRKNTTVRTARLRTSET